MEDEKDPGPTHAKGPRARNFHELRLFISLETCPACNNQLDENKFWLSAETETGAVMTGECRSCHKPMGFSFLGGNLLCAPGGFWDEVAPGRTEIIMPWKLAAEVALLSPKVNDDPAQLDLKAWRINRDCNSRIIKCAHELVKLLDAGKEVIADELLSSEDLNYCEQHPEWFTRKWIESVMMRHRKISGAIIKDLPRIDQLEKEEAAQRRAKRKKSTSTDKPDKGRTKPM